MPLAPQERRFAALCILLGVLGNVEVAAQPELKGQWTVPVAWPFAASHAALLADGRVLLWNDLGATPQIWNPVGGSFTSAAPPVPLPPGSAQVLLGDGAVMVLGGLAPTDSGLATVRRFTGALWEDLPAMGNGRFEPAAVLLGDGRALAISGAVTGSVAADTPEHALPGSGWISLPDAAKSLPRRPWSFLTSTGEVVVAGPERTARRLDTSGTGDWSVIGDMLLGSRDGGSAVPLRGDRFLIVGGRSPATASCEILDLETSQSWRTTASMASARRHHTGTLLADGSVLVTGGTLIGDELQHAVTTAERFDPVTEAWSVLEPMSVPRRRGSVALLLPDARVLVAGGGDGTAGSELHADAQIFSPPYLFQGARPLLTTAPDSVVYGDSLVVTTPDDSIAAVWFLRAGSVSGGFNADQRALELGFVTAPGQIRVAAPLDADAAPPGPYLLFLLHESGAPSLGRIVRLESAPALGNFPVITSSAPMTGSVGVQYVYDAEATSPGAVTWSLTAGPAWLSVNSANGIVVGIPTAEQVFLVTLRATNADGFVEQTWSISVGGTARTLIPIGAIWRYFKGSTNPGSTWATIGHNDSGWLTGPSGFGFGDGDDATVLSDMQGVYTTVYTRYKFTLHEVQSVTRLALRYDYDDGFAAFLNGTRIFSQRAPATITNTSVSTSSHEAIHSFETQEITDPAILGLLVEGDNVLAVVGLNTTLTSNDLTLRIELDVRGGAAFPVDVAEDAAALGRGEGVFPNPFHRAARVRFALTRGGDARLELFDVRGRRLRALHAERLQPGPQVLEWDGRDESGRGVVPGVYFYRLVTPEREVRGKLVRGSVPAR